LLGNHIGLLSDIGTGVVDFFYELVKGPVEFGQVS
jgi:hypothetical protein